MDSIYGKKRKSLFEQQFDESDAQNIIDQAKIESGIVNDVVTQPTLQDIIDKAKVDQGSLFQKQYAMQPSFSAPTPKAAIGRALQDIGKAWMGSIGGADIYNKKLEADALAKDYATTKENEQAKALADLKAKAEADKKLKDMIYNADPDSITAYKASGDINDLRKAPPSNFLTTEQRLLNTGKYLPLSIQKAVAANDMSLLELIPKTTGTPRNEELDLLRKQKLQLDIDAASGKIKKENANPYKVEIPTESGTAALDIRKDVNPLTGKFIGVEDAPPGAIPTSLKTEGQKKVFTLTSIMLDARNNLKNSLSSDFDPTGVSAAAQSMMPTDLLKTKEYQVYEQAKNTTLAIFQKAISGASGTEYETVLYNQMSFPKFGSSPEVFDQYLSSLDKTINSMGEGTSPEASVYIKNSMKNQGEFKKYSSPNEEQSTSTNQLWEMDENGNPVKVGG